MKSFVSTAAFVSTATNATKAISRINDEITAPLDIFALFCMLILFIVGVFGNMFTIYILKFVKRGHTTAYDLMLILLSISDLACATIVPMMFAYGTLTRFQSWVFGLIGCKILLSVLPVNVTISQGILMLMSIDRYRVISRPFERSGLSKHRTAVCTIMFMLLGIILVMPLAYSLEIHTNERLSTKTCNSAGHNNSYMLMYASINFIRDIVSTMILAVTGRRISNALITNSSNMARHGYLGKKFACRLDNVNNTRRMLFIMLIVFSVCTIPLDAFQFCLYLSFQILKNDIDAPVYLWIRSINTVLYLIQTSNAVVNIFIYGARHREFRPFLKRFSRARRSLLYRVFPKVNGTSLDGDSDQIPDRPSAMTHCSCEGRVRGTKIVQFNFDAFMGNNQ